MITLQDAVDNKTNNTKKIYHVRNLKVMLDSEPLRVDGIVSKFFNQAIKRTIDKFPDEFMFQLNETEFDCF